MNTISRSPLIDIAAQCLGKPIDSVRALTQGDVSEAFFIITEDDESYIIKNGYSPIAEGKMLTLLASHGINVPKVIAANANILILEVIQETNCLSKEAWKNLGHTLTTIHHVHNTTYGWEEDYAFGKVITPNTPCDNWVEFYANNRLGCYLSALPPSTGTAIERLIKTLGDRLPPTPPASLLHGDLWTGNILIHINRPYLIDPACYFGHNEVDIAMLNLFGSPTDNFYNAYPLLEIGWQERLPIYQLFPALVHYMLFGNHYLAMVDTLLQRIKS